MKLLSKQNLAFRPLSGINIQKVETPYEGSGCELLINMCVRLSIFPSYKMDALAFSELINNSRTRHV